MNFQLFFYSSVYICQKIKLPDNIQFFFEKMNTEEDFLNEIQQIRKSPDDVKIEKIKAHKSVLEDQKAKTDLEKFELGVKFYQETMMDMKKVEDLIKQLQENNSLHRLTVGTETIREFQKDNKRRMEEIAKWQKKTKFLKSVNNLTKIPQKVQRLMAEEDFETANTLITYFTKFMNNQDHECQITQKAKNHFIQKLDHIQVYAKAKILNVLKYPKEAVICCFILLMLNDQMFLNDGDVCDVFEKILNDWTIQIINHCENCNDIYDKFRETGQKLHEVYTNIKIFLNKTDFDGNFQDIIESKTQSFFTQIYKEFCDFTNPHCLFYNSSNAFEFNQMDINFLIKIKNETNSWSEIVDNSFTIQHIIVTNFVLYLFRKYENKIENNVSYDDFNDDIQTALNINSCFLEIIEMNKKLAVFDFLIKLIQDFLSEHPITFETLKTHLSFAILLNVYIFRDFTDCTTSYNKDYLKDYRLFRNQIFDIYIPKLVTCISGYMISEYLNMFPNKSFTNEFFKPVEDIIKSVYKQVDRKLVFENELSFEKFGTQIANNFVCGLVNVNYSLQFDRNSYQKVKKFAELFSNWINSLLFKNKQQGSFREWPGKYLKTRIILR